MPGVEKALAIEEMLVLIPLVIVDDGFDGWRGAMVSPRGTHVARGMGGLPVEDVLEPFAFNRAIAQADVVVAELAFLESVEERLHVERSQLCPLLEDEDRFLDWVVFVHHGAEAGAGGISGSKSSRSSRVAMFSAARAGPSALSTIASSGAMRSISPTVVWMRP